jgi:hypothetical protein
LLCGSRSAASSGCSCGISGSSLVRGFCSRRSCACTTTLVLLLLTRTCACLLLLLLLGWCWCSSFLLSLFFGRKLQQQLLGAHLLCSC